MTEMSAGFIFCAPPNKGLASFLTLLAEMPWRRKRFLASESDVAEISPLRAWPWRSFPYQVNKVAAFAITLSLLKIKQKSPV